MIVAICFFGAKAIAGTDDRPSAIKELQSKMPEADGFAVGACYADLNISSSKKARYEYYLFLRKPRQDGFVVELVHLDGVGVVNIGGVKFKEGAPEIDGIQGGMGTEERLAAYASDIKKHPIRIMHSYRDALFKTSVNRACH